MSFLRASDLPAMGIQYVFLTSTSPISQSVTDEIAKAAATVLLGIVSKLAYEWMAQLKTRRRTRKKGA